MKSLFPCPALPLAAATLLLLAVTGCDRDGVKVYHAAHEEISAPTPAAAVVPPPAAPLAPAENPGGKPAWDVPADWQAVEPGPMLFAKFSIGSGDAKADVNISQLLKDGGGLVANANRWRGQLGLNPLDETELSKSVVTAGAASLVDFSGTSTQTGKPARLIGAMVPQNGQSWFYKLMGAEKTVAAQKENFLKFVQSVRY